MIPRSMYYFLNVYVYVMSEKREDDSNKAHFTTDDE